MIKRGKYILLYTIICIAVLCCRKDPVTDPAQVIDPATGAPVTNLTTETGECYVSKIAQKNKSSDKNDNAFVIERDASFLANRMVYYDSLTGKVDYDIKVTVAGDTVVKLSTGEYFIVDKTTRLVKTFITKADPTDITSDDQRYEYSYNTSGYLVKKLIYINGAAAATYETAYTYNSSNLLTGCVLYAGSKKVKSLESVLDYDLTKTIKPWIYLFPDFFEGYNYLQALNFGKKGTNPVKSIVTSIYDTNSGAVIDTWSSSFSDYVISKDNFVLQTTAKGDQQQGLGFIFGTTRFDYQCTK